MATNHPFGLYRKYGIMKSAFFELRNSILELTYLHIYANSYTENEVLDYLLN